MLTLHYHKTKINLPESFNELSGKQFIQVSELLYNGGEPLKCHVIAFRILGHINRIRLRLMNPDLVARALEHVSWVFDHEQRIQMTNQLIPEYKGMYGPISDFDNLKMGEFHFSELYYKDLVYENNEKAIDSLVAVLYRKPKIKYDRKKNPDGDIRIEFNSNEVPYNAKRVSRWPAAVKQAIFLWYDSCRQKLVQDNSLVFKEPSNGFESQFETGLYGMMRSLAGDKLGAISDIEQMYVHTALLELGLIKEEEAYIEEQIKNQ